MIVKFNIVAFIFVMIFSIPLTIYPTNVIFESYTVDKWFKNSKYLYHIKNMSRFLITVVICYFAIELADVLDTFLGLLGAVLCAPLALMIPTFCHLKMCAKT